MARRTVRVRFIYNPEIGDYQFRLYFSPIMVEYWHSSVKMPDLFISVFIAMCETSRIHELKRESNTRWIFDSLELSPWLGTS